MDILDNLFPRMLAKKSPDLVPMVKEGVDSLLKSNLGEKIINNDTVNVTLFDIPDEKLVLIVRQNNRHTKVYFEHYLSTKVDCSLLEKSALSEFVLKSFRENQPVYMPIIFSYFQNGFEKETDTEYLAQQARITHFNRDFLESLKASENPDKKIVKMLEVLLKSEPEDITVGYSMSHVEIVALVKYLNKGGFMDGLNSVHLEHLKEISLHYCTKHKKEIEQALKIAIKMEKKVRKEGWSKENYHDFNDLDNSLWEQDGFVFAKDQNCLFIQNIVDKDNFIVYYLDGECIEPTESWNELKAHIEAGDVPDYNVAVEKKDGQYLRCYIRALNVWTIDMQGVKAEFGF